MKHPHCTSSVSAPRFRTRILTLLLFGCLLFGTVAGSLSEIVPALPVAAAEGSLSTNKTAYAVGEAIMVTAVGSGSDWVALYAEDDVIGAPAEGADVYVYWYYVAQDGNTSGTPVHLQGATTYHNAADRPDIADLPEGRYKLVLFPNGGYTAAEQISITIGGTDAPASSLYTDKQQYAVGEPIIVTATGKGNDWVALYAEADAIGAPAAGAAVCVYWYYIAMDGHVSGTPVHLQGATTHHNAGDRPDIADLPAGDYKLVLYPDGGYVATEQYRFTVGSPDQTSETEPETVPETETETEPEPSAFAYELSTDKTAYEVGEAILVTATGQGNDWVGLYAEADAIGAPTAGAAVCVYWYYIDMEGNVSGTPVHLQGATTHYNAADRPDIASLPDGRYKLVLYPNGVYEAVKQISFTVGDPDRVPETEPETEPTEFVYELSADKTEYARGDSIYVTATGKSNDWVGLWAADDLIAPPPEGGDVCLYWYYIAKDGHVSGQEVCIQGTVYNFNDRPDIADLPAGDYKLAICPNGVYEVAKEIVITIKEPEAMPPKPPKSVQYTRTAAEAGHAAGTVRITEPSGTRPEAYLLQWASGKGAMDAPEPIRVALSDGATTVYTMPEGTVIPEGADRILVWSVSGELISETPAVALITGGTGQGDGPEETEPDAAPADTAPADGTAPDGSATAEPPEDTTVALPTETDAETGAEADKGCASTLVPAAALLILAGGGLLVRRKEDEAPAAATGN